MNNWKELKESFVEIYKDKLRIELKVTRVNLEWYKQLIVKIMHPCANPCEEELLVYLVDNTTTYTNPWRHYSEKVEADLNEFIGIKLAEQREREELEKLSTEERAKLEKEKVSRILDSY